MAGKGSGPGHVQRTVMQLFEDSPKGRFTVQEIAAVVYPDKAITGIDRNTVGRALRTLAPRIGLVRSRIRSPRSLGWEHRWGKVD